MVGLSDYWFSPGILLSVIGPIPWGHSGPLSRVVVVVVVVDVDVVDINVQAARDSTASDIW